MPYQDDKKEKGREAETNFQEWLRKNEIAYMRFLQDIDSSSPTFFKKYMAKRPDFMILIPHVGSILVDVKHKKQTEKRPEEFDINERETKHYCNFQNYFNMQVWYVFSSGQYTTWHWIPVSKVLELGTLHEIKEKEEDNYCSVKIKEFLQVKSDENIGRLFTEMSKFY